MTARVLHVHEPRLGIGLPSRQGRPFRRPGEAVLESFLRALSRRADEVVLTGRLFDRPSPPAHLVDRVVGPLRGLVERGVPVTAPRETPRSLLFLAAGVRLAGGGPDGRPPEFWRAGAFRLIEGERVLARREPLPGAREIALDVTGLTASGVMARLSSRLRRIGSARFVRVVLTGESDDPGVLSFGTRELVMLLPPGIDGFLAREVAGRAPALPEEDDARREALRAARAGLPELPATTGVYEFVDGKGRVLYVGKAVNLRRRVGSHYTAEVREASPRGPMLAAARDVRWRETGSEVEALLAEAARIHEVRPPFNRQMRDPEAARYLRVDLAARWPSLTAARRVREDGATWYGPFPKRWSVERSLRVLQVVYGLRACGWREGDPAPAACTDRDLAICSRPCDGRIGQDAYRERVGRALDHVLGGARRPPPFGALNPLSAGLLGEEDVRVLDGFSRMVRRFLANLREANGTIPLPDGRTMLVVGGLVADVRRVEPSAEAGYRIWADGRIGEYLRRPRTWVPVERGEETRILARWLRGGRRADEDPRDA